MQVDLLFAIGIALIGVVLGVFIGARIASSIIMGTITQGLSAAKGMKKLVSGGGKMDWLQIAANFLMNQPKPPQPPRRGQAG